MNKPLLLLSLAGVALATRPARATTCSRWENGLTKCDVVNIDDCDEDESTWEFGVRRNWYNWHFSSTAQKACKKLVMKWWPGEEDLALAITVNSTLALCYHDWDGDDIVATNDPAEDEDGDGADDDDYNGITTVWVNSDIEREPECDLVPAGPYTNANAAHPRPIYRPMSGASFPKDARIWAKDENIMKYGSSRSDAHPLATPQTNIGDSEELWYTRFTLPPYEDDPDEDTLMEVPAYSGILEVDHIIPRIDIHGCKCGSSGYNNMALVSGTLNRKMSNNMRDPDRIKMLQTFVPGYVPPAPRTVGDDAGEKPPADAAGDELGGCSTSRGGIGWLAAVSLALIVRRRRR